MDLPTKENPKSAIQALLITKFSSFFVIVLEKKK
jgi:hypothetical protein